MEPPKPADHRHDVGSAPPDPLGHQHRYPSGDDSAETDDPSDTFPPPFTYTCPECGQTFTLPSEPPNRVAECPACQAQFFTPGEDDSWRGEDEEEEDGGEDEVPDREAALNEARIKQVTALRRGLYRTRNYIVIGAVALVVAAGQLVWVAVRHVHFLGWGNRPIGYLFAAAACLILGVMTYRRVADIDRELRDTVLPEPAAPPDLSALSDGSQRMEMMQRNLERIRGRRGRRDGAETAAGAEWLSEKPSES